MLGSVGPESLVLEQVGGLLCPQQHNLKPGLKLEASILDLN